ncbi:MAG: SRPBCC family protein [Acidiferrobacterales bacterium]|nr:SRPBCC family protein [Acidiferrobacterales bacterium]
MRKCNSILLVSCNYAGNACNIDCCVCIIKASIYLRTDSKIKNLSGDEMKITKQLNINASSDAVWHVLGPRYEEAGLWASAVYTSTALRDSKPLNGAPVSGRVCETSLGPFRETIVGYDSTARYLAYQATGTKMPFFVKRMQGSWKLNALGATGTEVNMTLDADIMFPFDLLMGWMMKIQFNKVLNESLEELKHYVEKGEIHQRKARSMAKATAA